jgi:structural maintenance of chromosome 2
MSIAPGKVHQALDLVGYPEEVAAAMAFVFGDAFICDDPKTAKDVTFSANVRTVTVQGDVYDPSGTLTGGAAPTGSGVLIRVQELLSVEHAVGEAKGRVDELTRAEERQKGPRNAWKSLAKELDLKEHEMKNLEGQVENSNAVRVCCFHFFILFAYYKLADLFP